MTDEARDIARARNNTQAAAACANSLKVALDLCEATV